MQVVRGRLNNRQAIIEIGVQRFKPPSIQAAGSGIQNSYPIMAYRALLDTGAQRTCLSSAAIMKEELSPHGKRFIKNVHNENIHRLYMVSIGFWCVAKSKTNFQENDRSYFGLENPVEVINIADNSGFDAIIGMDVLQNYDVCFLKDGTFEIKLTI
jgi:hypothetical protein